MTDRSGSPFVNLEVRADAVKAAVWLNDVPLLENSDGRPRFIQQIVNHWVVDGDNKLRVLLSAHEDPTRPRPPQFQCRLVAGTFGMREPPTQALTDYSYNPTDGPLGQGEPQEVCARTVPIDHPYERWKWQNAAVRNTLSEDDRVQLQRAVMQLQQKLAMRNARGFAALVGARNAELSRAFDLEAEDVQSQLVEGLQGLFNAPGWTLEPLTDPAAELDYRTLAGGRVIEVTRKDGGPALRGGDGQRTFTYPVLLSLLNDDEWTVIR